VDRTRRELRTQGVPVPLGGRAFDIVEVLAQSAGELVTKDEIIRRVWSGAIVEESTLQVHISAIRKALGPDRGMLKTAFGRGYRLLGAWPIRQEGRSADPVVLQIVPPTAFATNFPSASFDLIGRAAAVQHLLDFLSAYRVVTLTGPGGIGKSALALEVARTLFPAFGGDAWLVELASLSDPDIVPSAFTGVLGLKLGGDEISAESVARAIGGERLLLVLDNCEHVIDAAAQLVETPIRPDRKHLGQETVRSLRAALRFCRNRIARAFGRCWSTQRPAMARDWTVISMKNDWKREFSFE